ncbi:MAG: tetratricopeptide repeat protein [Thermogutta sp.]|nr:tetratricopeptide repeat protein [Thermogutta sp.]
MHGYQLVAGPLPSRQREVGRSSSEKRALPIGIALICSAVVLHGFPDRWASPQVLAQAEDRSERDYRAGRSSCSHHGRSVTPIYVVPPLAVPRTFSYSTVVPGPVPYALYYRQQTVWMWRWDAGSGSGGYCSAGVVPYTFYQWQAVPLITTFPLPGRPVGPVPQRNPRVPRNPDPQGPGRMVPGRNGGENGLVPNDRNAGNDRMLQTAWRFLKNGDRLFAEGKYREAYGQYRSAAKAVPRLAEAYFRQVFALTAFGAYEPAARAVKTGLELHPDWPKGPFRLDNLYGNDEAAKREHIARLAEAVQQAPQNGDLLFLLGVMLHFDNRADEAQTFFAQAAPLMAGADRHIRLFLEGGP